jgi:hypothetical protein
MSMATRTDTQSPALHVADSHDLIRVQGARENNLKDVSVEIPKRRLTVFTGVSGSGKSSLVFGTIAAESQRLINETYSAFVQGFMPTLARPEVALRYVDEATLSEGMRWVVRVAFPVAAVLMALGFFLSVLSPDATEPNALINLTFVAGLLLAVGLLVLGVGLIRGRKRTASEPA